VVVPGQDPLRRHHRAVNPPTTVTSAAPETTASRRASTSAPVLAGAAGLGTCSDRPPVGSVSGQESCDDAGGFGLAVGGVRSWLGCPTCVIGARSPAADTQSASARRRLRHRSAWNARTGLAFGLISS
jgi:hypothetical protein